MREQSLIQKRRTVPISEPITVKKAAPMRMLTRALETIKNLAHAEGSTDLPAAFCSMKSAR